MSDLEARTQLAATHTHDAIRIRLSGRRRHSYLSDFIYGGIDGAVTTFAVVAGVTGAGLDSRIIIVLGLANLVGDGFSMAAANFLGVRATAQELARARADESHQIEHYPEGEREEIRQIFTGHGVTGDALDRVVEAITSDRNRWIDTMITHELGMALEHRSPARAGSTTFVAFMIVGAIPLVPFLLGQLDLMPATPYGASVLATGIAFFLVGAMKCRFVDQRWWFGGTETLAVGGLAAALAYAVGVLLRGVVSGVG